MDEFNKLHQGRKTYVVAGIIAAVAAWSSWTPEAGFNLATLQDWLADGGGLAALAATLRAAVAKMSELFEILIAISGDEADEESTPPAK